MTVADYVQDWLDTYGRDLYRSEASVALVTQIYRHVQSVDIQREATEYLLEEQRKAEELRQAVSDAAANIK